jgi:tripartite-type tricarboxylate transporter receptor subunit TctC
VNKVAADVAQALKTPEVQKRMADYGVDVEFMGPEKFAAYIKAETVRWGKVVKQAGIQGQ